MKHDSEVLFMAHTMRYIAEHKRAFKNAESAFKTYGKGYGILNADEDVSRKKFYYVYKLYMEDINEFKNLRRESDIYMEMFCD